MLNDMFSIVQQKLRGRDSIDCMKLVTQLDLSEDGFLMVEAPADGYDTDTEVYKSKRVIVTLRGKEIEKDSDGRDSALSRLSSYEFYDEIIEKLQIELIQRANSREIGRELDTIEVKVTFMQGEGEVRVIFRKKDGDWY